MAAVDRVSELPESILHRILSSLSHKQAIQTSALSRTWRHVGPTGPKIELRERRFKKSGRASFLFVLGKTLQRYNNRNLPVHEFILEMSSSESKSNDRRNRVIDSESVSVLDKGIPMLLTNMGVKKFYFSVPNYVIDPSFVSQAEFLTELYLSECKFMTTTSNDHEMLLFKGLKRLSLNKVHIKVDTLEKIVCSCPLIEYLLVSCCVGLKTIPLTIFQSESLTELHITGESSLRENLIFSSPTDLISIKLLKTLSLERVNIPEETLDKIMCSCPLIQCLLLTDCVGLTNIRLIKNNNNLKHFSGYFDGVRIQSIEIDAPTIETIRIVNCPNWYGHNKYYFPHLKSLCLNRVKLSAELFESFSSNFPSLENLELEHCYGFSEVQLTLCSVKRLVLSYFSTERMVITIYAPNIRYFEVSTHVPPRLTFSTETACREWKSRLIMLSYKYFDDKVSMLPWLIQLSELLNSLRESQISLEVCPNLFKNLKVDAGFGKPVPLEHMCVKGVVSGSEKSSTVPNILNCLFFICRPKYVGGIDWNTTLAEYLIFKILRKNLSRGSRYLWERDLEEITMQVWDQNSKGWRKVGVEGTSFSDYTSPGKKIRFTLKWRD